MRERWDNSGGSYCDLTIYEALYARFLDKSPEAFFITPISGCKVVDLCGGSGRLAIAAKDRGASEVMLVDQEVEMMLPDMDKRGIETFVGDVQSFCDEPEYQNYYDVAFCIQAANYWLTDQPAAEQVAQILRPGGQFVFNSFANRPPYEPWVKQYKRGVHHFVEVSWLVDGGKVVYHVQIRDGLQPHVTSFDWISPQTFLSYLEPYFHVDMKTDGPSVLFHCWKKENGT